LSIIIKKPPFLQFAAIPRPNRDTQLGFSVAGRETVWLVTGRSLPRPQQFAMSGRTLPKNLHEESVEFLPERVCRRIATLPSGVKIALFETIRNYGNFLHSTHLGIDKFPFGIILSLSGDFIVLQASDRHRRGKGVIESAFSFLAAPRAWWSHS
jgi:hypothetical protein